MQNDAAERLAEHLKRQRAVSVRWTGDGYTTGDGLTFQPYRAAPFDPTKRVGLLAARLLRVSNGLQEAGNSKVFL